ncbi:aspartic proteinase CDR1-like [Tripterygium wilfordii]|uniref:aspartic proteinase CDR1-like n=1 Tax=Tripterygium wilfordii TaxID=458696 RepID=UPI0018F83C27|nr:aspartic proteinase CDR1-like [Tripterygium wilfordii]
MDSLTAVHCLHFLTLAALFLSISAAAVTTPNNTSPPQTLVMKLIHHDSILSPFHNSTGSVSDRAERLMRNAIARSMFLDSKASVQTNLILDSKYSIFSVSFFVGQPPVPQFAILDTGSYLLWIQCEPCQKCFQQSYPIFDPSKSSTYKEFSCNDPLCIQFGNARCDSQQRCGYGMEYMDNSKTEGTLALEQLSFQATD